MFKYTMIQRKPLPVYKLNLGDTKVALLSKTNGVRSKRWLLDHPNEEPRHFPSRRAAFHFFKTGEKFETKPVFLQRGKTQKRIR